MSISELAKNWKTLASFAGIAVGIFGAGITTHAVVAEQAGMPGIMAATVKRVTTLEERVRAHDAVLEDLQHAVSDLQGLPSQVDSLRAPMSMLLCITQAQIRGQDPFAECTLSRRDP